MNALGFRRIDHLSITVADANAAAAFYIDALGATELYRLGPLASTDMPRHEDGRDWTDAFLGVPDASLTLVMLRLQDGLGLELFQYHRPASRMDRPSPANTIGAHHIGLEVEDMARAVEHLTAKGCSFMAGPIMMSEGPIANIGFQYLLDPFGNILELVDRTKHLTR